MIDKEIVSLVRKIASTSSRNEKVSILKKCESEFSEGTLHYFRELLFFVYNPETSFGVTWNDEWVPDSEKFQSYIDIDNVLSLLDDLADRRLTGNEALTQIELTITHTSEDCATIAKWAIDRSLDCGIDEKTIRKVFPDLLPFRPNMMKCEPANEKSLAEAKYPAILQVKSDGMRLMAHVVDSEVVEMYTFNGTRFMINNQDLLDDLTIIANRLGIDDVWLDGELLFIDESGKIMPRKKGNGLANSILKKTAKSSVHKRARISLWDAIPHDKVVDDYSEVSNIDRFSQLIEAFGKCKTPTVTPIEYVKVDNIDQVYAVVDAWIERGEEGGILKNFDAPWEGKRSKYCFKFKSEKENEFKVVDWVPGERANEGLVGSLTVSSSEGKVVTDVSGMTDDDRYQISANILNKRLVRTKIDKGVKIEIPYEPNGDKVFGGIVTVRYNELISSDSKDTYSLFLPRIIEFRLDKDDADSLETIKATKNRKKA